MVDYSYSPRTKRSAAGDRVDTPFTAPDPWANCTVFAADTAVPAGGALLIVASVAGNVSMVFAGGQTIVLPIQVGVTILPFAVTRINTSGTTATLDRFAQLS